MSPFSATSYVKTTDFVRRGGLRPSESDVEEGFGLRPSESEGRKVKSFALRLSTSDEGQNQNLSLINAGKYGFLFFIVISPLSSIRL